MKQVSTVLTLLILTAHLLNIVSSSQRCESEDGSSSIRCKDSEKCCEDDYGNVDCCTSSGLSWVGIVVIILVIIGITVCFFCCFYYFYKNKSSCFDAGCNDLGCIDPGFNTFGMSTNRPNQNVTVVQMVPWNPPSYSEAVKTNAPPSSVPPLYFETNNTNSSPPSAPLSSVPPPQSEAIS